MDIMKVKDCMCNDVKFVTPNTTVCDCAKLMSNSHIGCVPVCDDSKNVVGVVTDRDVILRAVACDKDCKTIPVSDIMTSNVCCCDANADVKEAENLMSQNAIRRLPVIENNKIIGILTLGDLAQNEQISTEGICDTLENICDCKTKNAE